MFCSQLRKDEKCWAGNSSASRLALRMIVEVCLCRMFYLRRMAGCGGEHSLKDAAFNNFLNISGFSPARIVLSFIKRLGTFRRHGQG